jgi:alpha-glucosidase
MQWDSRPGAGFTSGKPWPRLSDNYADVNVAALAKKADSILSLYRALIALRNREPALHDGRIETVAADNNVLRYERADGDRRLLIVLNFSGTAAETAMPSHPAVLSTHMDAPGSNPLRPYEGRIFQL